MYTINKNVLSIKPYEPGKPIKEVEREFGVKNPIKLASNENVWGPSQKVINALSEEIKNVYFYPEGSSYYLNNDLASFNNLSSSKVVSGAGSNEIIELALRVLLNENTNMVTGTYSFAIYTIVAKACGAKINYAKNSSKFDNIYPDAKSIIQACDDKTSLIIIDNPGNPTGVYLNEEEMLEILNFAKSKNIVLISDEAYLEYVRAHDYCSMRKYFNDYENLMIFNTFSKAYGLAGLRVGYALAHEKFIDPINRIRKAFNVNILGQIAASTALKDQEHVKNVVNKTHIEIDFLYSELSKLGIKYYQSQTNFILIKVNDDSKVFFEKLISKGVIVRPLKPYKLDSFVRISVGNREHNIKLINAIKEVINEGK